MEALSVLRSPVVSGAVTGRARGGSRTAAGAEHDLPIDPVTLIERRPETREPQFSQRRPRNEPRADGGLTGCGGAGVPLSDALRAVFY